MGIPYCDTRKTCAICGKKFVLLGDARSYVYKRCARSDRPKHSDLYYCSWTCYRAQERADAERRKKMRKRARDEGYDY